LTTTRFTQNQQALLKELFLAGAVLIGDQVRARFGLNSPIYFNLREPLYRSPDLLWKVGREFTHKICELTAENPVPQCVVGCPDTATPLAVATVLYASQHVKRPKFSCAVLLKHSKQLSDWIGPKDGAYEYNLLDDVVASGLTKRSAAQKMQQEGIWLRRIVVLFDRQQGDGLREDGFELHAIFAASDVLDFYLQLGLISPFDHRKIKQFLSVRQFNTATL
jgi:orotate phosphoribosyltransferase